MKFTLGRSAVLNILLQALKTCESGKDTPHADFLIRYDGEAVSVTSVTTYAQQTLVLPVEDLRAEGAQEFTVDGAKLVNFVRQFGDDKIACGYSAKEHLFGMGSLNRKSQFLFPAKSSDRFVPIQFQPQNTPELHCDGAELSQALRAVAVAAAKDAELTPQTAVRLRTIEGRLLAEASDNYRIATYEIDFEENAALAPVSLLLPRTTAITLASLMQKLTDSKVTIRPGKHNVRFEWTDTIFTASLESALGKPFPDLSYFLSTPSLIGVRMSRQILLDAIKRAQIFAGRSAVTLAVQEGALVVAAAGSGESQEAVTVEEVNGEGEGYTTMACAYLQEAISAVTSPWVELEFRQVQGQDVEETGAALVLLADNSKHLLFPILPHETIENEEEEGNDASETS